jgi:hypothetical protein
MSKISDAWFFRLKAAQRDLIAANGGIERAADRASVSKSNVGRWNNAADPEIMTLPAVLLLQAECGMPFVTAVMAELNGRRLADPDAAARGDGCVAGKNAEVMRSAAELMATAASAFSDGRLSPAEAAAMDRCCATLDQVLDELRLLLAGHRGDQVVRLGAIGGER